MSTTLGRKAWRDLGRRRARAVLTSLTIALSVAGTGMLAVPSLIDRTMDAEVRDGRVYDVTLHVRDMAFDEATAASIESIPNVRQVVARVSYATRALIGDRRIPVTLWGLSDVARQPIDALRITDGTSPDIGQVLSDSGNERAVDVGLRAGDVVRLVAADRSVVPLTVSGTARGLTYWQSPWDHPKQLVLYTTDANVRSISGSSGIDTIALRLDDTRPAAVDATVVQLRGWLDARVGPGAFTDLPDTRYLGEWPGRAFVDKMTSFVYVLAALAMLTALFLIANTMNTLMAEQTAEIGIMKAVGGRRRQIAGVFVRSALYLAAFGILIGVPLGALLAWVISGFITGSVLGVPGRFAISIPVVAFSVVFAIVITVGASLPALRRALRIPVREALEHRGVVANFGTSRFDRLLMHGRRLPRSLRFAVRSLARNKRRTIAVSLQISVAVATALGFLNMAVSFTRSLDHDYAVIPWDASLYAPQGAPRLDAAALRIVAATPGVDRVEPVLVNSVEHGGRQVVVYGMTATALYTPELRTGRWYTAEEATEGAAVAVIGPNAARERDLAPGDVATVRTAGGDVQLLVVGVDSGQRDDGRAFYVPLGWLQRTTGWDGATNMLWLSSSDPDHRTIDRTTNAAEDALASAGYRVAPEELYVLKADNKAANDAILNMIVAVGGVVVAIGMVGLVNSITMNVIERTREIGILRCVGARARDIRRAFTSESVLQAGLGWVVGLPLGLLLSWGLARLTLAIMELQIATVFDPVVAVLVLLATVTLAALVVLAPIRRATNINPGDALRYV